MTNHAFTLHDGLTVCLYEWPCDFSVVALNASKEIVCHTCSRGRRGCQHIALLDSIINGDYPSCLDKLTALLNAPKSNSVSRSHVSPYGVSKERILFKPDHRTSDILKRGYVPVSEDVTLKFQSAPETDQCPTCDSLWSVSTQNLPLITDVMTYNVQGTSC